jgi:hypothetical protein
MEVAMALKPITLRLDEEEYERLKQHLSSFGDPDINVAYVVRAYIRDLNRTLPFIVQAGWDLKTYFGFLGVWLKQVVSVTGVESAAKGVPDWWQYWTSFTAPLTKPGARPSKEGRKETDAGGESED